MPCHDNMIATCSAIAGETRALMARIERVDDPYLPHLTAEDVESIAAQLYDLSGSAPETVGEPVELQPEDVVFELQLNDARWTRDSEGFNFLWRTRVPERDKTYEWRITITSTADDTYVLVFRINSR